MVAGLANRLRRERPTPRNDVEDAVVRGLLLLRRPMSLREHASWMDEDVEDDVTVFGRSARDEERSVAPRLPSYAALSSDTVDSLLASVDALGRDPRVAQRALLPPQLP